MSISCEFSLLKQAHETLVYCGQRLDPLSAARYDKLFKEFSSFIITNRNPNTKYDEDLDEMRMRLLQEGQARVCKGPDYDLLRRAFGRYVSDAGMAEIKNLLSHPRDPLEGDCF
jgi:hypothetical protein